MIYKKDLELQRRWVHLLSELAKTLGSRPRDLNNVLFLIGVQELGKGMMEFTKEQKQDLMHIGTCKILSLAGFYKLEGLDEDGWPHWKPAKKLPKLDLADQEKLLKIQAIEYFEKELKIFQTP